MNRYYPSELTSRVWAHGVLGLAIDDFANDITQGSAAAASHFDCDEVDTVAALLWTCGYPDAVTRWIASHAYADGAWPVSPCATHGGMWGEGQRPNDDTIGAYALRTFGGMRDAREQITATDEQFARAVAGFAGVFSHANARDFGGCFTCSEADTIASVIANAGHRDDAATWLAYHGSSDEDDADDLHAYLWDGTQPHMPAARSYAIELSEL